MTQLYALIGTARSGKSTIAKQWVCGALDINDGYTIDRRLSPDGLVILHELPEVPRAIVCADDIRLAMGCRYNYLTESQTAAYKEVMIRTLLQKHDVLVDGTHTTVGSIKKILHIDTKAQFMLVDTCPHLCKMRALDTYQRDLFPIIDRMANNLEKLKTYNGSTTVKQAIEKIREEVLREKYYSDRMVVKNSPAVIVEGP